MNPLCPSSPAARVSAYCSTAVLQCCRRHAALHVAACVSPGSAATLCCSRHREVTCYCSAAVTEHCSQGRHVCRGPDVCVLVTLLTGAGASLQSPGWSCIDISTYLHTYLHNTGTWVQSHTEAQLQLTRVE